ncbi:NAC transcription factor 29 [Citrus clementina]|uniref:NAC transcription factor 29 n=1 Tax=Citrus clementina TaxID=85681 RepID=UPI000CED615C|nr:NAC transcription factor 29 [Citrus x clementina]
MQGTRPPLPLGCKFQPSDGQLVLFYLFNKISGTPAPFLDDFVRTENLYGNKEPWQIWRQFGGHDLEDGEDLYFFTHLKKKSVNSSRIDRRVGTGTWQGEDVGKAVVSRNSRKKIGSKKRFRYEKDKSPHNGCWIMHEYSLNPSLLPQNLQSSDLKTPRKKRKLDEPVVEEDIDQPAEPVVVEEHQYQYLQETQPQTSTELVPCNHLQLFQSHQLMQQTPSDFFRAQEENYQHSMTQEDPHDLELSDSHQNMQETQVTDQNSHEQLQLSAETHQHFASSNLHEYQQSPVTDQIRHHQLQLSVEVYQSTVHNFHSMLPNPPNFQENQQLPGTEQSLYDQLDKTIQNHQQMLQTPANIEGCQHLLAFDDTFQWLLDSSDDNLSFDINGILNEG